MTTTKLSIGGTSLLKWSSPNNPKNKIDDLYFMWVISGLVFWISFIFIMSFGAQEYQHRFFHSNVGHKKGALLSNNSQSHIFP